MRKIGIVLFTAMILAGCGHQQLAYTPKAVPGMDRQQAVAIVEQVFYEDFSKTRPQSVVVTDQYIALSEGLISKGTSYGSAAPLGTGAIAVGSSTVSTKEVGQRLYFNSMASINVYQQRVREGRYAVIIRAGDGGQQRVVKMRTLEKAQRFADALEYLRTHSS
ncbi:hypothetical protein Q7O56_20380 [Pseudomonas protegens]|uniref:hypothetical protein n=1 Tax=Pseudomonas protegens TaxID=380021 RepID=UPI00277687BD|nr:hypothetical protein [Pseudomonas protegens]MDP9511399.1 hypothetical protein [Pseudomonas protegens]